MDCSDGTSDVTADERNSLETDNLQAVTRNSACVKTVQCETWDHLARLLCCCRQSSSLYVVLFNPYVALGCKRPPPPAQVLASLKI